MNILTHPLFWKALEDSGSINESRGMMKYDLRVNDSQLIFFSKTHSYGEYIFDWSWAQAYSDHGMNYYPKLLSMVPFTPATASHFQGAEKDWPELLSQHEEILKSHTSSHFLFTTPQEQLFLGENGYSLRDSFQYHFLNADYKSFEHFLEELKTKKAKNIRNERNQTNLRIEKITGEDLKTEHAQEMYDFYLLTLEDKRAIPYLTVDFFKLLVKTLPHNVLYVRAKEADQVMAGSLFYYDEDRLYGRYWGAKKFVPHLHFELCYYQGIEFCIDKKIKVFEAGAQGEHKIARGFTPVLTTSAHKINHPGFSDAIKRYIEDEKKQISETLKELKDYLPFKKN